MDDAPQLKPYTFLKGYFYDGFLIANECTFDESGVKNTTVDVFRKMYDGEPFLLVELTEIFIFKVNMPNIKLIYTDQGDIYFLDENNEVIHCLGNGKKDGKKIDEPEQIVGNEYRIIFSSIMRSQTIGQ